MINSKTLGTAAGVQYQGVIDKSEGTNLPSLANGVIIGRFKRGRMDKPFKVTASNYQALLGRDPSNPSYLAVEDAFKRGVSEVSILRVGEMFGVAVAPPVLNTAWELNSINYEFTAGNVSITAERIRDDIPVISTITVVPTVADMSAHILSGNYNTEVNKAILDIDAAATDWILDLANNAVIYTDPSSANDNIAPSGSAWYAFNNKFYYSANSAAQANCDSYGSGALVSISFNSANVGSVSCSLGSAPSISLRSLGNNTPVDFPVDNEKSIPIDTVAAQVIANAEAGHVESQEAIKAVALEHFNVNEYDAALDAAAVPK